MPKVTHTCILHNVCIVDTQGQYSGNTRLVICIEETGSAFWKRKICDLYSGNTSSVICIVETQDLHSGNTRAVICIEESQDL